MVLPLRQFSKVNTDDEILPNVCTRIRVHLCIVWTRHTNFSSRILTLHIVQCTTIFLANGFVNDWPKILLLLFFRTILREITFNNAEELTEEGLPLMVLFYHPNNTDPIKDYKKRVEAELISEKRKQIQPHVQFYPKNIDWIFFSFH